MLSDVSTMWPRKSSQRWESRVDMVKGELRSCIRVNNLGFLKERALSEDEADSEAHKSKGSVPGRGKITWKPKKQTILDIQERNEGSQCGQKLIEGRVWDSQNGSQPLKGLCEPMQGLSQQDPALSRLTVCWSPRVRSWEATNFYCINQTGHMVLLPDQGGYKAVGAVIWFWMYVDSDAKRTGCDFVYNVYIRPL